MTGDAAHCQALVRDADRDAYLASLFAPDEGRGSLLALAAFQCEIARIPAAVSEPQLGEIRLQWWRDTLSGLQAGQATAHPVASALAAAVARHRLPWQPLLDLIDAHAADLYDEPLPDLAAIETYLGHTGSAPIQLAALILAGPAAAAAAEAAGFGGVAYGLARILAGPPRQRRLIAAALPPDEAAAHAGRRLAEARARRATIPDAALPAFLPVSLTDLYLDCARRPAAGGTPRQPSQLRRQWRLWRAARREAF